MSSHMFVPWIIMMSAYLFMRVADMVASLIPPSTSSSSKSHVTAGIPMIGNLKSSSFSVIASLLIMTKLSRVSPIPSPTKVPGSRTMSLIPFALRVLESSFIFSSSLGTNRVTGQLYSIARAAISSMLFSVAA
ncbi:hypothetical protein DSECCO2_318480 [anaerobic digester metagenome]